jgi:putative ABC transport system permease protein
VTLSALDRKLFRDLLRLRGQVVAIALVLAAGVATVVMAVGTMRSLDETRRVYYERHRFADVFAEVERAPEALAERIAPLPGVAAVETRISRTVLLDVEGMAEPASARLLSLPEHGALRLNTLYMRAGRLPEPTHPDEVVVNEAFAEEHGFRTGDSFGAILDGHRRRLEIVGIALSPEFIYVLAPGNMVPDDRRFAVVWMGYEAAAAAFDLDGAFDAVSLRLLRDADEATVIDRLDDLLERYGSRGAYGREDQLSHHFLENELEQIRSMAMTIPPIFLAVAAFLLNITLDRLIATERELIGLLKALGYRPLAIGWHYAKLVLVIVAIGTVIGFALGTWLGNGLTLMYADFFRFPFLFFQRDPDLFVLATLVALAAALLGTLRAVLRAVRLPPAVAMAPPTPPRFRRHWYDRIGLARRLGQPSLMIVRQLTRWPVRAGLTVLGLALGGGILVGTMFFVESVEHMIDVTFFRSERSDATLVLAGVENRGVVSEALRLPGVLRAEPVRRVAVRLHAGHRSERTTLVGRAAGADLSQLLDNELEKVEVSEIGLLLPDKLAEMLAVGLGDRVRVEILEGRQPTLDLPVTALMGGYVGIEASIDLAGLNRALRDPPVVSSVNLLVDPARRPAFYEEVKGLPAVASLILWDVSLQNFRGTVAKNLLIMTVMYTGFAGLIAVGVVYNSARIALSERGRELASLRVLGFTASEVSWILLGELGLLTLASIPLGWLLGHGLAWLFVTGIESELFRVPMIIGRRTHAHAALIVILAAVVSGLVVRRRIGRFDLIAVLKTRE